MVETIARNAKRLISMIDDLLAAAQVMTGELQLEYSSVDIVGVLRQAGEAIEPVAAASGVTVEVIAPATAITQADERRLFQILDNLLSNAVKYSPEGGHVTISCRADPTEITVAVSDEGIGSQPTSRRSSSAASSARPRPASAGSRAPGSGSRTRGPSPRRTAGGSPARASWV